MAVLPVKLAVLSLLLLILLRPPTATGQEVEEEKEFSYELGSENGPENWGNIHQEWEACGSGRLQSPIDLHHDRVVVVSNLAGLRRAYLPAPAVLKNRGHDIMLKWEEDAGFVWINRTKFSIKQLHWHSPSEHTINNRRYDLELHMVHESADNKIVVISILYTIGRHDPFITELEGYIKKLVDVKEVEEKVGFVDPWKIKWGSRKYYRYLGSLTTPPCTEGVTWTILKKVRTVSREQIRLLREAVHDNFEVNARPKQPVNERSIYMYRPTEIKY